MNKLECKSVRFYSEGDELSFFNWLNSIEAVDLVQGAGNCINVYLKKLHISDECLRELIAVFFRYRIEMTQLGRLLNNDNAEWFQRNTKAYWHQSIFSDCSSRD